MSLDLSVTLRRAPCRCIARKQRSIYVAKPLGAFERSDDIVNSRSIKLLRACPKRVLRLLSLSTNVSASQISSRGAVNNLEVALPPTQQNEYCQQLVEFVDSNPAVASAFVYAERVGEA